MPACDTGPAKSDPGTNYIVDNNFFPCLLTQDAKSILSDKVGGIIGFEGNGGVKRKGTRYQR